MASVILLTGERAIGKTTVCRETVARAQAEGHPCGGILTLARDDAREILDVSSGDTRRLTVEADARDAVEQGRFRFDPRALIWANGALARATPCDLLVVDELGPLEVERGEGWVSAFDVLRAGEFTLAVAVVRPELLAQVQRRLRDCATAVLAVARENRDQLPDTLVRMLEEETR
jgi:nucleoside-triphosphatase THEP1